MELSREIAQMDAEKLRDPTATLLAELTGRGRLKAKQLKIDQLTHEMATLKRYRFDRRSEQMNPLQRSLLDESIDADIDAICLELEELKEKPASPSKEKAHRAALPACLPRSEIRHEPDDTECGCGCRLERIGEDVSEKLDYTPRCHRGGAPYPGQMDLPTLRDPHPSAGGAAYYRQRHPDSGSPRPSQRRSADHQYCGIATVIERLRL